MVSRMTKREMFEAIVAGKVDEAVVAQAKAELEKLDVAKVKKAEKAKSAKAEADAPVLEAVLAVLGDEFALASDVAKAVGVSTQKAMALLKKLVEAGSVEVTDVKVEKVGMRKAFKLV